MTQPSLPQRLKGKVALITGGASGIGRSIARRLATEGASVIITDTQAVLGAQTATEDGCTFLEQNVCDEARWADMMAEVGHRFRSLDILVNNAGILGSMEQVSPENTPLEQWREIFAVNVEGVFLGCRAAIGAMRRMGGGAIINISSVAGLRATPFATAYGASKAAVTHLTRSVAQYCAQEKLRIRCNSVHPGDVRTPLWDRQARERAQARGLPIEALYTEAQAIIPLGDLGTPEDIAAAVAFLASDDARHMTGTSLIVDGGSVGCDTFDRSASASGSVARNVALTP